MKTERFSFLGFDGMNLPAVLWLPEGECSLILQITHGMTEHIGRYEAFAQELTAYGIAVAGFDLRGHGQNPGNKDIASFGRQGWEASIGDMKCFYDLLEERFPGKAHYLFGFSLGSFLLREYLGRYFDGAAGAVIVGTGHQPQLILSVLRAIVKGQWKKVGFDNTSDLVRNLSFGTYNQKFKPNRTTADWLCGDENQLDAYLADPLVRRDISAGLFWALLGSMKFTGSSYAYDHWEANVPILLLSGQDDPVGDGGKGVQRVYRHMQQTGLSDVTLHLLVNARHDLLHEENSGAAGKAKQIIIDWLLRKL